METALSTFGNNINQSIEDDRK